MLQSMSGCMPSDSFAKEGSHAGEVVAPYTIQVQLV